MNQITVHDPLKTQLDNLDMPVEVVDETGRQLGHFLPRRATAISDECPYSETELAQMRDEQGGRSLPEIWKSLGAI